MNLLLFNRYDIDSGYQKINWYQEITLSAFCT